APVSMSGPQGAPAPEFSPERASVSKSNPKKDYVPPTRSCLLLRCCLAAHLLTLSPPSVRWAHRGTPPQYFDPAAPLWLLACSSPPWPGSPLAPPGSLVPPPAPWTPLLPLLLISPALSGFSIPPAPPWFPVAPAPLWPPGSTPLHRSLMPSAPPRPSGSSSSPGLIGSLAPPQAPPPPAPPPSVNPLELSALPPPWLQPPSAPPWAVVMTVAWAPPGSSCSKSLLLSPWILPKSSPPWTVCHPPPGYQSCTTE
ncbi:hypothetical protein M9458_039789, partial [Cirrhinus mrigala]